VGDDRREGWRLGLTSHGLSSRESSTAAAPNDRHEGAAATEWLLAQNPTMTAVVAASDELALGAQVAASRMGRKVSVVGYDDGPMALAGVGLTTIQQPIFEIAHRILRLTARLIDGERPDPVHERVAPRLVVRGSTGANQ
jgi:LacI family transcriptional regulator